MVSPWKPPIFDRIAVATVVGLSAVVVVAFVALGLEPSPLFIVVAAILVGGPIVEAAIFRRRMRDVWHSQRLYVQSFEGDLASAIEPALEEAGLAVERESHPRTSLGPEREVLRMGDDLNVTVISAPRGHVVYVGPLTDDTRSNVDQVKRVVDKVLADKGA